jgi:hypothetical protein
VLLLVDPRVSAVPHNIDRNEQYKIYTSKEAVFGTEMAISAFSSKASLLCFKQLIKVINL